jgi:hypothetical protein
MIVALILATGGGCWFNLRFLWALHRELQLAKLPSRVGKRTAVTGTVTPQVDMAKQTKPYLIHSRFKPQFEPQQEEQCGTLYSSGSR